MRTIYFLIFLLAGILSGCSSVDLNKSLQSIGLSAPDDPKKVLNPRALDRKDYNAFNGKWSLGPTAGAPQDRLESIFEFTNNEYGKVTTIVGENSQICSGRARVVIEGTNKFLLVADRLTCDDKQVRNAASFDCVVNDNQMSANCSHSCIRRSDLHRQVCELPFKRSDRNIPKTK